MGFFSKILGRDEMPPTPEFDAIPVPAGSILAPVSGKVTMLENVPDPVFAGGLLGAGCGIWPEDASDMVRSPVEGTVTMTTATNHALDITTDDGVEVLIHLGVDTVEMEGEGFVRLVEQGQRVEGGQPLMTFDRKAIVAAGYRDVVIVVVANTNAFRSVTPLLAEGTAVLTGETLIHVALENEPVGQ